MTTRPRTAMLLAAGLGQRMRPLTEHTAKPLLPLGGKALLDHALDRLVEAGVETVVVNAFWHADRVAARLAARAAAGQPPRTILRREATLLDTGGGTRAALDLLGADPFYVVNGDAFWLNGTIPALLRLADAFDPGSTASCWCIAPSRSTPMSASATSRWTNGATSAAAPSARSCPTSMPACSSSPRLCWTPCPTAPSA